MAERISISKSLRFEVFKRDAFTCQYCGSKSPDVVLHVDHIDPVANGGENNILNLITSCAACNLGKSATPLDDHSELNKQRRQLEELNERRNQLELMITWREGLRALADDQISEIQKCIVELGTYGANETGVGDIRRWLVKFPLSELLAAVKTSFAQYIRTGPDGLPTVESWNEAFAMVPRIAKINMNGGLPPGLREIFYVRGILRRRLQYVNEATVIPIIQRAVTDGLDIEEIKSIAKRCSSWSHFQRMLNEVLDGKN